MNENETWNIEKLKNPGNRFATCTQKIGCNKKVWGIDGKILYYEMTEIKSFWMKPWS